MLALTEAEKAPGEFAEPPLRPGPDADTCTAVALPVIAMVGVCAVWPAVTLTLTEAGATEMTGGAAAFTTIVTLTVCVAQATGVQPNVSVPLRVPAVLKGPTDAEKLPGEVAEPPPSP